VAVARAGGQADLVGAIGDDGQWVLSHLKSLGVNVSGLEIAMVRPFGIVFPKGFRMSY